ncbi:Uncharacterised protein [Enterobacter cloacae]|nr:Uncharacterised protein [Enterobacter cloacae]
MWHGKIVILKICTNDPLSLWEGERGEKLLRNAIVPDHIRVQPLLIPLHIIAHHDLSFALVNEHVRRGML